MRSQQLSLRLVAAFALVSGLVACGGSGDTSSAPATDPSPPPAPSRPDPLLGQQWHLFNTGQSGGLAGSDLNLGALSETGAGVQVAVVDAAVQIAHPDLAANHLAGSSFNYLTRGTDPSPAVPTEGQTFNDDAGGPDDAHGTAVAGILAAVANNGVGGRGVAPATRFMAFNPLALSTDVNMADAMARAWQNGAAVVNNSWGPPDPSSGGSGSYYRSSVLWQQAVEQGTALGRGGRGTVYLIASGNGGASGDDSNRDGYANHRHVLAIGAVDDHNRPTAYTEPGANVLVAAPSGNVVGRFQTTAGVVTTDIAGERGYATSASALGADHTSFFDGTSASTPMAAGVAALMLEANPRLGWRDVRWILAATALPASLLPSQPSAQPSAMNTHGFQTQVGFGRVNASGAVGMARSFAGLPPERSCSSGSLSVNQSVPDNDPQPQVLRWNADACGAMTVEFATLRVVSDHAYSGDLRIDLRSPQGRVSNLARPHSCLGACTSLTNAFALGSVRHMGEPVAGEWNVLVSDEQADDVGRILSWELVLYGH